MREALFFCCHATPFGSLVVIWSKGPGRLKIVRVLLSGPRMSAIRKRTRFFPHAKLSSSAAIRALLRKIDAFLQGREIRFPLDLVYLDLCSPFQRKVLRAEHAVPRGIVTTYSRIAQRVGHPRAARAIGTALATNPFPIIIPCHRAICSDGRLGGFLGGARMKRRLLLLEGVKISGRGSRGRVTVV